MKITHINPTDEKGGASIASYRVHKSLSENPMIDSILFVYKKYSNNKSVIQFTNPFFRTIEAVLSKINYVTGIQYLFSINWIGLLFHKRLWQTDLFIIGNIHGGYLPIWFPWFLSRIAPVAWQLHDMWPFTAKCTYSYECRRFEKACGKCPHIKDYPKLLFDSTSFLFKLKKLFYNSSKLYIVSPSEWMFENSKKSPVFQKAHFMLIPHGIDIELFRPQEKRQKLSLITASADLGEKRKGAHLFPEILNLLNKRLKEKNISVDFYWMGKNNLNFESFSNINNIFLGFLKREEMAQYYASSHVFILPTMAEAFGLVVAEAMACGTPAVVFDIGGCRDLVKHKQTGYLARAFDINDFVNGIIYVLDNRMQTRDMIVNNFTLDHQKQRYLELIKEIHKL